MQVETEVEIGGGISGPASAGAMVPSSPQDFIPEKFRVTNDAGLDIEASARRLAESYTHLEKRVGTGDMPPKAATDYAITVPDQFREHWQEDDRSAAFRDQALAAGLTQKQLDFVMGKYFEVAPELVNGAINSSVESVSQQLTEAWGQGPEYDRQFNLAVKGFNAFADPQDRGDFDGIMKNPAIAYRMLARIGLEVGEAGGIPAAAETSAGDSIRSLLTSDAARDPKHPSHRATREKIDAYYRRQYGDRGVE